MSSKTATWPYGSGRGFSMTARRSSHPPVAAREVFDPQEEADPTSRLVADDGSLPTAIGAGQQDPRRGPWRAHHDLAFGGPVASHRRRVLDKIEAERIGEEADRLVVVVHDDGDQVDMHAHKDVSV
jgi:hypothetical protein